MKPCPDGNFLPGQECRRLFAIHSRQKRNGTALMLPIKHPEAQFFQSSGTEGSTSEFLLCSGFHSVLPEESQARMKSGDPRHIQSPRLSPVRQKIRHSLIP